MPYTALPAHHADPGLPPGRFVHALEPGSVITDAVRVYNLTAGPATFDVYAGDMVERLDGGVSPAGRHEEVVGAGSWITPALATITIPPRSSELVAFTVTVPAGTVPGPHLAALLVEPRGPETEATIALRARLALRVELEVLGEIDLGVQLGGLEHHHVRGDVRFRLPVTNTGTVTFAAEGFVVVSGRDGAPLAEVALEPAGDAVAPAGTAMLRGTWDAPWFARVTAQPVVEATVGDRAPRSFVGEPVTFWLVPWTAVLVGSALVLLLISMWIGTRSRRLAWRQRHHEERQMLRTFREEHRRREGETGKQPVPHGR